MKLTTKSTRKINVQVLSFDDTAGLIFATVTDITFTNAAMKAKKISMNVHQYARIGNESTNMAITKTKAHQAKILLLNRLLIFICGKVCIMG